MAKIDIITIWAARNRHLVKPITLHCPVKNAEFHERVKVVRARLAAGFVGIDVALVTKEKKRFKFD